MVSRSFFLAFFFTEERTCWHGGILGDAAVVAFAAAAFAGKHGLSAFLVLLELHVFLDCEGMGHGLDVKVVCADDHFRNHGFLLTPKGWTHSPAYDINPGAKSHQCLLIDSYTEESDINALLSASESYMLEHQEASEIIEEVRAAIKDWRKTATELQIPPKILESYSIRWDEL